MLILSAMTADIRASERSRRFVSRWVCRAPWHTRRPCSDEGASAQMPFFTHNAVLAVIYNLKQSRCKPFSLCSLRARKAKPQIRLSTSEPKETGADEPRSRGSHDAASEIPAELRISARRAPWIPLSKASRQGLDHEQKRNGLCHVLTCAA